MRSRRKGSVDSVLLSEVKEFANGSQPRTNRYNEPSTFEDACKLLGIISTGDNSLSSEGLEEEKLVRRNLACAYR